MKRILVTYATIAGSTAEVASAVAEEIAKSGATVEVQPVSKVTRLDGYDGVVLGAPMNVGWHRAGFGFLRRFRAELQGKPLAVFVLCMSLTKTANPGLNGVQVVVDENLPKPPLDEEKLTFRERYSLPANYLRPIVAAIKPAKPASIGVFGGRLEYGRLKWWAVLFAMFVVRAPAGDKRNWPTIRKWANNLGTTFANS